MNNKGGLIYVKKRLIFMTAALCSLAISSGNTAFAASHTQPTQIMIEEAENRNYYETVIETSEQEQPPFFCPPYHRAIHTVL